MGAGELTLEVARRVDADNAGSLAGVGDVDALDPGVAKGLRTNAAYAVLWRVKSST